jgi:hypothetical protein
MTDSEADGHVRQLLPTEFEIFRDDDSAQTLPDQDNSYQLDEADLDSENGFAESDPELWTDENVRNITQFLDNESPQSGDDEEKYDILQHIETNPNDLNGTIVSENVDRAEMEWLAIERLTDSLAATISLPVSFIARSLLHSTNIYRILRNLRTGRKAIQIKCQV